LKVILDEGVPEALADRLTGHQISTVRREGWGGIQNGTLLELIETAEFQAFITNDKRMERERDLVHRPFATLILSVSNWKIIRERI
jgi:hypothetical protein